MAQMAAHLVEQVMPWVPTRQWVVSVPIPLRDWMASSKALTATVHTIIRRAISQYDVNEAVKRGRDRKKIQAGSVTCVQRVGGAINLPLPYHMLFVEGVSVDRPARGAVSLERLEADANGDLLSTVTRPWSDGTTGITRSPLELLETLAALGPLPQLHLGRSGGCLAPPSQLRGSITHAEVIRTMLRHGTLATAPPPIAPARACQDHFAWAAPSPESASSRLPWGPVVAEVRPRRVTRAAGGEHERVRDVLRSRRKGVSGQAGGLCPHARSLAECVPGAGDGWTPRKMCFKIPIRPANVSMVVFDHKEQAGLHSQDRVWVPPPLGFQCIDITACPQSLQDLLFRRVLD
jgi:hypothetical protein